MVISFKNPKQVNEWWAWFRTLNLKLQILCWLILCILILWLIFYFIFLPLYNIHLLEKEAEKNKENTTESSEFWKNHTFEIPKTNPCPTGSSIMIGNEFISYNGPAIADPNGTGCYINNRAESYSEHKDK